MDVRFDYTVRVCTVSQMSNYDFWCWPPVLSSGGNYQVWMDVAACLTERFRPISADRHGRHGL